MKSIKSKSKDYFNAEIQERKVMSKKLSKYIAAFAYFDSTLIVLSTTSGGISDIYFSSIIGVQLGIASASFSLVFSLTAGIIKKLLKMARNKMKKHNKIALIALIDLEMSHEEYKTIFNKEDNYRRLKENIRMMKSDAEKKNEFNEEEGKRIENNKNIRENNEYV